MKKKPITHAGDIAEIRRAISRIPREWQRIGQTYLQKVTRRDILVLNVLAPITGILVGYACIGFRYLIAGIKNLVMFQTLDWTETNPVDHTMGFWIWLAVPSGILAAAAVSRFLGREAKGHGVPEVIEAVVLHGGRMRKRSAVVKTLASGITIASGGSVGREGPIVQIGAAIASLLGQLVQFEPKLMKPIVGCGAAAAVAATFNTPIAGVIFAIELIVLELRTRSFVPLVLSSVFATVISRHYMGDHPTFVVPPYHLMANEELFFYLFLGLLCGVVGVVFIKTLYGTEDLINRMKSPWWLKAILGGLIIASISHFYPGVMGMGYETVTDVLQGHTDFELLFALLVFKIFCTSLTLGAGGSGGVFAPSLFIGAMTGGVFGYGLSLAFPSLVVNYGAYALVGMAALFSATNRATFTAIVILFEMTLEYNIILPLMFACVAADQTAWLMIQDSIDTLKLKRKGLDVATDVGVNIMALTLVRDLMTTSLITANEDMNLSEAKEKLMPSGHTIYPVVGKNGELKGVVRLEVLRDKSDGSRQKVSEVMESTGAVVFPNDTVLGALKKIESTRDPRILVVDRKTHKLVGIVSPVDFVRLSSADVE